MARVIHFSGGQTSAYMTILLKPQAEDIVLFTDTGREHPETYKFIEAFEQNEGIKVHSTAYTHKKAPGLIGFDALVAVKKYLPNRTQRICTEELKVMTARRYLVNTIGIKSYESYIGFRADELQRVHRYKSAWKKVSVHFPLAEMGITKADVNNYWNSKPYKLNIPSILGNCDLCFLKGKNNIIKILQQFPELAEKWIHDESIIPAYGDYTKPATYISGIRYEHLLDAAKSQQQLFELDGALPAYSCSCST